MHIIMNKALLPSVLFEKLMKTITQACKTMRNILWDLTGELYEARAYFSVSI